MKITGIFLLLMAYMQTAAAVTVVVCEDSQRERTYQTKCPPGTTQINQKDYSTTGPAGTTPAEQPALILYRVLDCPTCDQVKEFLTVKNLQFTETDISMSIEMQDKVKQLAGELQVPVLTVGDKVIIGYNRPAMIQTLTESGHIAAGPEPEPE